MELRYHARAEALAGRATTTSTTTTATMATRFKIVKIVKISRFQDFKIFKIYKISRFQEFPCDTFARFQDSGFQDVGDMNQLGICSRAV